MSVVATRDLGQSVRGRWLYRHLDIECGAGTFCAVIGPNGSGKSTLLRQLTGVAAPQEGEARLDGMPLAALPPRQRARSIAYLPQSTPLYYDLRVRELVLLGRAPYLSRFAPPSKEDEERAAEALQQVGVAELADRGVTSLSGGELQRVMLARMLATLAPVLVLDEPTTALDIGHALEFLELCRRLQAQSRTLIMAMHDLELASRYATKVLLLTGEGTWQWGEPKEVMTPETLGATFHVRVAPPMSFLPRS